MNPFCNVQSACHSFDAPGAQSLLASHCKPPFQIAPIILAIIIIIVIIITTIIIIIIIIIMTIITSIIIIRRAKLLALGLHPVVERVELPDEGIVRLRLGAVLSKQVSAGRPVMNIAGIADRILPAMRHGLGLSIGRRLHDTRYSDGSYIPYHTATHRSAAWRSVPCQTITFMRSIP